MNICKALIFSILTALLLSACGGSSSSSGGSTTPVSTYTGVTTPATIDADNAEIIGTTSTEAVVEAITRDSVSIQPVGITVSSIDSSLNQIMISIAESFANTSLNLPLAADTTILSTELASLDPSISFCGGSATVDEALVSSFQAFIDSLGQTLAFNGSMTFNDLCVNAPLKGEITLNGTVTFTTVDQTITISYNAVTISDGTSTQTITMSITCSTTACTITSDYAGIDSNVYRVEDLSVSDNGSGTYTISATFYHPDYGSVSIIGSDLTFGCANGLPGSGQITYSSSDGTSGTITFSGCNDYTGTWSDSPPPAAPVGSYSGSWL